LARGLHRFSGTRHEEDFAVALNNSEWGRVRHEAKHGPLLDSEQERVLLRAAQAGDQRAAAELVQSHMRLVVQIASAYARDGLSVHDLVGEGALGLMEAIRRFDLGRGARFASYAGWWVRACVRRHALANRRIVGMPDSRGARVARSRLRSTERALMQQLGRRPSHRELASVLGVSERDVELVDTALSSRDVPIVAGEPGLAFEPEDEALWPEQAVAEAQSRAQREATVQRALETLNERERALICEHLFCEDARSLAQLARALGVSRQRAGQILAVAREKLRARLACVA
jgi:RNA polymerase sigma-32 factor